MDKLYRVFTWMISAFSMLLLAGVLIALLRAASNAVLPFVFLGLLICSWILILKRDTLVEPRSASYVQSALVWASVLLELYAVFRWLGYKYGALLYFCGVRSFYLLAPVAVLTAVLLIVFRPFSKHSRGLWLGIAGIISGLFITWFVAGFFQADYAWRGKHLPVGYVMRSAAQRRFFPENAYDFEIEGTSVFLNSDVKWSCKVSGKDFEAFCKRNGYRFVLNRTDMAETVGRVPSRPWGTGKDWPEPWYYYDERYANGGGLTMRYLVPEQKLYGVYGNR